MGPQNSVKVTFVIPALNEEKCIADTLSAIHSFTPRNLDHEILVGDHGSRDATSEIAQKLGAKPQKISGGTVGELRNRLVENSLGNVLIFNDADIRLTPLWSSRISDIIHRVQSGERIIFGGSICPPESNNRLSKYWFSLASPRNYVGTGHMIIAKSSFIEIGGFDRSLSSGEDYEFCQRAKKIGYKVELEPQLKVVHVDFPETLRQFFRREIWHGIGDVQSLRTFFGSRVAILAAAYSTLILAGVFSLLLQTRPALAFIAAGLAIPATCSIIKFPKLNLNLRLGNIAIWNFYLLARSLSFFYKSRKKRPYDSK